MHFKTRFKGIFLCPFKVYIFMLNPSSNSPPPLSSVCFYQPPLRTPRLIQFCSYCLRVCTPLSSCFLALVLYILHSKKNKNTWYFFSPSDISWAWFHLVLPVWSQKIIFSHNWVVFHPVYISHLFIHLSIIGHESYPDITYYKERCRNIGVHLSF